MDKGNSNATAPRRALSFKSVIIIGILIGIFVVIVGYFVLYFQQQKALERSKKGAFPVMADIGKMERYFSGREGEYFFKIEEADKSSTGPVKVWGRLVYSKEGKDFYMQRRKQMGMFVAGLDKLAQRNILYEIKCEGSIPEYAIVQVFEIGQEGKTLDYARAGSRKEWGAAQKDSPEEKLVSVVCGQKKE